MLATPGSVTPSGFRHPGLRPKGPFGASRPDPKGGLFLPFGASRPDPKDGLFLPCGAPVPPVLILWLTGLRGASGSSLAKGHGPEGAFGP
jgi:hypothetical protein